MIHNMIHAEIKVLGKTYKAKGQDITEAIANLKVPLGRGTSILTIKDGDNEQSKVLGAYQTARLFSESPTVREVNLKQTAMRFSL